MIKTVLFDLGNVLVAFSHERMYRQLASVCGIGDAELKQTLDRTDLYHALELGEIDANEFVRRLEKECDRELDVEAVVHAGTDIFFPITEMEPIIAELARREIRLVLLSNTCRAHFEHARARFPVLRHISDFVLSFQEHARKPSAEIYEAAKAKIECEPCECLYVDDIADFVAAGQTHGFLGHVFRNSVEFTRCLAQQGVDIADPA